MYVSIVCICQGFGSNHYVTLLDEIIVKEFLYHLILCIATLQNGGRNTLELPAGIVWNMLLSGTEWGTACVRIPAQVRDIRMI